MRLFTRYYRKNTKTPLLPREHERIRCDDSRESSGNRELPLRLAWLVLRIEFAPKLERISGVPNSQKNKSFSNIWDLTTLKASDLLYS